MIVFKCKMCGGDLNITESATTCTCEYCGSVQTLPTISSHVRANLFNRANHFRRQNEFDKAIAAYERILEQDDSDAEAHWGAVLSRYGIEYVDDPATHERIPTCHRVQPTSILSDEDYLAAVKNAPDGLSRELYEHEAKRIAEIQRDILAISSQEQPYDVFICYKETADDGSRTRDSALAQEIYYQLTNEGYKVFFSRISLEDKLGEQYGPYIFAALNSAKVMLVVGTKPENFSSVWVKNEWSRYLDLMRRDHGKLLIPCYRDMDPYDLPDELSSLQSQDMGKIGFMQDLIRGVKKVLDAGKEEKPQRTVVVAQGGDSHQDALLKRGQMALEDGEWQDADGYFDRVLDMNAECATAYLGKFLASKQCATLDKYVDRLLEQTQSAKISKVEAVPEDTERISAAKARAGSLWQSQWANLYSFDRGFEVELPIRRTQQQKTMAGYDGEKLLHRATQFADEKLNAALTAARNRLNNTLQARTDKAKGDDEANSERIRTAYARHLDEADRELEDLIRQAEEFETAAKRRKHAITAIGVAAAIIAVATVLIVVMVIIPSGHYKDAEALLAGGDQAVGISRNLRGEAGAPTPQIDTMPASSGMLVATEPSATIRPGPTSVPASVPRVSSQDEELHIYIPELAPTGGTQIQEGMLMRSGELQTGPLPSPTP